jgi:hypothetical protein
MVAIGGAGDAVDFDVFAADPLLIISRLADPDYLLEVQTVAAL